MWVYCGYRSISMACPFINQVGLEFHVRFLERVNFSYVSTSSTSSDKGELSVLFVQAVSGSGDQADTGGAEWMADGQRATPQVKLVHGNGAYFTLTTHVGLAERVRVECLHVSQYLTLKYEITQVCEWILEILELTAKASWNSNTSMSLRVRPALSKTFGVA